MPAPPALGRFACGLHALSPGLTSYVPAPPAPEPEPDPPAQYVPAPPAPPLALDVSVSPAPLDARCASLPPLSPLCSGGFSEVRWDTWGSDSPRSHCGSFGSAQDSDDRAGSAPAGRHSPQAGHSLCLEGHW